MPEKFDPYHRWLSIPPTDQPPSYYRLLGVAELEAETDVIEDAAERQMAHVRRQQIGPHADYAHRLLNELAKARTCLLDSKLKADYDKRISQTLNKAAPSAQPAPKTVKAKRPGHGVNGSTKAPAKPPPPPQEELMEEDAEDVAAAPWLSALIGVLCALVVLLVAGVFWFASRPNEDLEKPISVQVPIDSSPDETPATPKVKPTPEPKAKAPVDSPPKRKSASDSSPDDNPNEAPESHGKERSDSGNLKLSSQKDLTVVETKPLVIAPPTLESRLHPLLVRRLQYKLEVDPPVSGPLECDARTGRIAWAPSESDGPGRYQFTLTAETAPDASHHGQQVFHVVVEEVNTRASLQPLPQRQRAHAGEPMQIRLQVIDEDRPPNPIKFRVSKGPASQVHFDEANQLMTFTPSLSDVDAGAVSLEIQAYEYDHTQSKVVGSSAAPWQVEVVGAEPSVIFPDAERFDIPLPNGKKFTSEMVAFDRHLYQQAIDDESDFWIRREVSGLAYIARYDGRFDPRPRLKGRVVKAAFTLPPTSKVQFKWVAAYTESDENVSKREGPLILRNRHRAPRLYAEYHDDKLHGTLCLFEKGRPALIQIYENGNREKDLQVGREQAGALSALVSDADSLLAAIEKEAQVVEADVDKFVEDFRRQIAASQAPVKRMLAEQRNNAFRILSARRARQSTQQPFLFDGTP